MTNRQSWKRVFCSAVLLALFSVQSVWASPVPTLSTVADPQPAIVGSPVGVDVKINGAIDVYAYQYSLSFDPTLLQVSSIAEGAFLMAGGTTFFDGGFVDNAAGTISFTFDTLIGAVVGVTGSGVLAHINFDVIGFGTSVLAFSDVLVLDSVFNDVGVTGVTGSLVAVPEPASVALLGLGLVAVAASRRRQTR